MITILAYVAAAGSMEAHPPREFGVARVSLGDEGAQVSPTLDYSVLPLGEVLAFQEVEAEETVSADKPQVEVLGQEQARAEFLITQNRFDEARELLHRAEEQSSNSKARANQIQFLLGMLDLQDKDYDGAIGRFRRVLVSDPKAVRVRLEMGRAYFLSERFAHAQRQFRYARAGDVPEAVRRNIDRYLASIRQLKTFSYGFSVAISPDSNLNGGPGTDTVSLYGLPFQLDGDARANSGVGLILNGSAEYAPIVGKNLRWRVGTQIYRAQYSKTQFDDMTLSLYTGPHLTLRRWDLNLGANVARRWYGNQEYSYSYGGTGNATYFVTSNFGIGLGVNLVDIRHDRNKLQDGFGVSVGVNVFHTPTAASSVQAFARLGQQDAKDRAFAFKSRQFGLSYTREFAGGFTAGIAPNLTMIDYEAPLAAFPEARRDRQYGVQFSLLNRRLDFYGLTPRATYSFVKNQSNIALFEFKRNRFEIGFTSAF